MSRVKIAFLTAKLLKGVHIRIGLPNRLANKLAIWFWFKFVPGLKEDKR